MKSGSKKQLNLWFNCDNCNRKLLQSNLKSHEKNCNLLDISSYIENDKFFGSKQIVVFKLPEDYDEIPKKILNQYIFVPQDVAAFCKLVMGCYILLEINEKHYVRKVWTVDNKFADTIFIPGKDFTSEFEQSSKFHISKLTTEIHGCSELTLELIETKINEKVNDEFIKFLQTNLKGFVLTTDNRIFLNFHNKKIEVVVRNIKSDSNDEVEDLVKQFSELQVNQPNFYFVDKNTRISIQNNLRNPTIPEDSNKAITLDDFGGYNELVQDLVKTMEIALGLTQHSKHLKITRGASIYGVSGSGKTTLCHALANHFKSKGGSKIEIESWKLFSKFFGETENNLKKYFDEAFAKHPMPAVIIIDELSNISSKNDSGTNRVSTVLLNLMDQVYNSTKGSKLFVLANTTNLDLIDPNMRRSGRFDLEVEIAVPTETIRQEILEKVLKSFGTSFSQNELKELARNTHGFVAADLKNLLSKSMGVDGMLTAQLALENIKTVKPTAIREIMIEKPNVKWSDIGGMSDLKLKLKQIVDWPINHPETFERLGIKPPRGLLMFGPPGCSKTMIAKALATESNLNFISIKGSDLFSMWVGESEKAVSQLFAKARRLSPCIVFFDEIDAIGSERSSDSGSSVKERVLAQILTEIDGVNILKNVIIVAATNRPDLIDTALLRPGRLDRIVYVQLPDVETRKEIFKLKLAKVPIADDVSIEFLAQQTEGYSGAEIDAVCKEAALKALEESFDVQKIDSRYFAFALDIIKPRASKQLLELYENYNKK